MVAVLQGANVCKITKDWGKKTEAGDKKDSKKRGGQLSRKVMR